MECAHEAFNHCECFVRFWVKLLLVIFRHPWKWLFICSMKDECDGISCLLLPNEAIIQELKLQRESVCVVEFNSMFYSSWLHTGWRSVCVRFVVEHEPTAYVCVSLSLRFSECFVAWVVFFASLFIIKGKIRKNSIKRCENEFTAWNAKWVSIYTRCYVATAKRYRCKPFPWNEKKTIVQIYIYIYTHSQATPSNAKNYSPHFFALRWIAVFHGAKIHTAHWIMHVKAPNLMNTNTKSTE